MLVVLVAFRCAGIERRRGRLMVETGGIGGTLTSAARLRCGKQMEEVGVNGDRSILEHLTIDLVADKEVRVIQTS